MRSRTANPAKARLNLQCCTATVACLLLAGAASTLTSAHQQNAARDEAKNADATSWPLNSTSFPCGDKEWIARRIDYCAHPLMDFVLGKAKTWPSKPDHIATLCAEVSSSLN